MFQVAMGILTVDEQREFHQLQGTAFSQLPHHTAPVETTAQLILCSMYEVHPWVSHWETMLWHMAQTYKLRPKSSRSTVVALVEAPWEAQPLQLSIVLTPESMARVCMAPP